MQGHTLSVRRVMFVVAIMAMDFAVMRSLAGRADRYGNMAVIHFSFRYVLLPACVSLLPLTLLALAAWDAAAGLIRRGRSSPFATGFLLAGGLAHALAWVVSGVLEGFFVQVGYGTPSELSYPRLIVIYTSAYSGAQILVACIGGVLAARFDVALARGSSMRAGQADASV